MNRAIQILFAATVLMCMCCGDDTEAEVPDHGQFGTGERCELPYPVESIRIDLCRDRFDVGLCYFTLKDGRVAQRSHCVVDVAVCVADCTGYEGQGQGVW